MTDYLFQLDCTTILKGLSRLQLSSKEIYPELTNTLLHPGRICAINQAHPNHPTVFLKSQSLETTSKTTSHASQSSGSVTSQIYLSQFLVTMMMMMMIYVCRV